MNRNIGTQRKKNDIMQLFVRNYSDFILCFILPKGNMKFSLKPFLRNSTYKV